MSVAWSDTAFVTDTVLQADDIRTTHREGGKNRPRADRGTL